MIIIAGDSYQAGGTVYTAVGPMAHNAHIWALKRTDGSIVTLPAVQLRRVEASAAAVVVSLGHFS